MKTCRSLGAVFYVLMQMAMPASAQTYPHKPIRLINSETVRILNLPEVKERFAALGASAAPGSPEDFAAQIKRDYVKWAGVIKSAGITLE